MIDITSEELILVRDIPSHLPKQPSGKKLHISAIYRWMKTGIQGERLETVFIAGCRYSSKQALNRYWSRVTQAKDGVRHEANKAAKRDKSTANHELEKAGW